MSGHRRADCSDPLYIAPTDELVLPVIVYPAGCKTEAYLFVEERAKDLAGHRTYTALQVLLGDGPPTSWQGTARIGKATNWHFHRRKE